MVRAMAKKCETANGVALDRQAADTAAPLPPPLLLSSSLPSLVLALFGIASISIVVVAAATYKTHVVFQR